MYAVDNSSPINLKVEDLTLPEVIKSFWDEKIKSEEDSISSSNSSSTQNSMPILYSSDFVGRSFLISKEDNQYLKAWIVKALNDIKDSS